MIGKDWVLDAAIEIRDMMEGIPLERDHDEMPSADQIRDIINDHCPFKPDTAYMIVPMCETCARWERHKMASELGIAKTGNCHINGRYASINATRLDFGCVKWEAK
jgi:hypothetical protein